MFLGGYYIIIIKESTHTPGRHYRSPTTRPGGGVAMLDSRSRIYYLLLFFFLIIIVYAAVALNHNYAERSSRARARTRVRFNFLLLLKTDGRRHFSLFFLFVPVVASTRSSNLIWQYRFRRTVRSVLCAQRSIMQSALPHNVLSSFIYVFHRQFVPALILISRYRTN